MTSNKPARNEEAPGAPTPEASNVDPTTTKGDTMQSTTIAATSNVQAQTLPIIAGHEIAMDEHGRFNLNAIHRAGGGQNEKRPSMWTRLNQAQELITEMENQSTDLCLAPIESRRGGKMPGTFAHELLAVSYAGWISPRFQLQVNQVFLDYRMGHLAISEDSRSKALPNPLSPRHQRELQKAIAGRIYSEVPEAHRSAAFKRVYSHLKDRFEVGSYKDIDDSRYTEALGAIQSLALEGEWMAARSGAITVTLDESSLSHLFGLYIHFKHVYDIYDKYSMYEAMSLLGSRAGVEMHDHLRDGVIMANSVAKHLKPQFDLMWALQPSLRRM